MVKVVGRDLLSMIDAKSTCVSLKFGNIWIIMAEIEAIKP